MRNSKNKNNKKNESNVKLKWTKLKIEVRIEGFTFLYRRGSWLWRERERKRVVRNPFLPSSLFLSSLLFSSGVCIFFPLSSFRFRMSVLLLFNFYKNYGITLPLFLVLPSSFLLLYAVLTFAWCKYLVIIENKIFMNC